MHTGFLSSHIGVSFLGNKVCMARRSMGSGEGGKEPGVILKLVTGRGQYPSESDS